MGDDMRSPSPPLPPLPPDPSLAPAPSRSQRSSEAQPVPAQTQRPSMAQPTPPIPAPVSISEQQSDVKRVDSTRSRPSPSQQQRPLSDVVNTAMNTAIENAPATKQQFDPDFIKQISEQVLKSLQEQAGATALSASQAQQEQPAVSQRQESRSLNRNSIDSSVPQRYTPPTPEREREARDSRAYEGQYSPRQSSPVAGSNFSRDSRESMRSDESRDTPRPFKEASSNVGRRMDSKANLTQNQTSDAGRVHRKESTSDRIPRDSIPVRKESKDSQAPYFDEADRARRSRTPSASGETTLEKIWQPLFDNGNPTMRLGQFLRGLALCLINDYEPKGSLVVTPEKVLRFLNETRVKEERYPWDIIFDGTKMRAESLSQMYRKLLCQHHFVQRADHEIPNVPGLTPRGFEWFMACLIQAHPDTEFERLSKAVMNMPISNADDKTDRFPKELSRRLLPAEKNVQAEQRLLASLYHEPYIVGQIRGAAPMPPPPPAAPPQQPNTSFTERERQPYSHTAQAPSYIDDEDLIVPAPPIERERKPYTAKEGSGKTYEQEQQQQQQQPQAQYPRDGASRSTRAARSGSGAPPQPTYSASNTGPSEAMNIPSRSQRMPGNQGGPPPSMNNNGGFPQPGRGRSPPLRDPYRRSDPFDVGSAPAQSQFGGSYMQSQSYAANPPREQYPGDTDPEAYRRHQSRSRTTTMGNSDDDSNTGRGYPIPSRGAPVGSMGSNYEYGGSGMPPPPSQGFGPPPVGSYPARGPMSAGPDRRRSMYGATPTLGGMMGAGDGGTDGYGSYAGGGNGGYPSQQSYGSSTQQ